ncbi:hypothetical protein KC349_g8645 [Hortaea werneckii]|nr:hypothetical protein KC349_g8645 [Hortaea werneckii]
MHEAVQVLLKRRPGTTVTAFRAYYQNHHAKLVLPWCKANGVTYYAHIRGPLTWTKPHSAPSDAAISGAAPPPGTSTSTPNITLAGWDAAAEMVFLPDFQLEEMKEREYYQKVILPDERKFLLDEARAHMVVLAAGSVEGMVKIFTPTAFKMQVIKLTFLALCTTLVSAGHLLTLRHRYKSGTDLLVNDLLRLDEAIKTITTAANNYTGGQEGYEAIRESFAEVNRTNRIAYRDAMTIMPQTIEESNQIISIVSDPIAPDITTAVDAVIAKKTLIDEAGFRQETADGLNLISYDHDTLSLVAVAPKLNPVTIPAAAVPVLRIDLDWRRGVAAFGGVPLAPLTKGGLQETSDQGHDEQ